VERLGSYHLITAVDESGPPDPRPGQFYMLASERGWGGGVDERPYLPRAFSYARAHATGDGLLMSFLLEAVGPGTTRLAELRPGEGLGLLGPLGIGFRAPPEGSRPLLVGGGIGAAPLLCLEEELLTAGRRPATLLGFRTAGHAQAAALFAGDPQVATDDGSVGRRAIVTELLAAELDRDGANAVVRRGAGLGPDRSSVYACGPPAMLEAVRALCAEREVSAQLAMESGMACGFGACFGCVVPTRNGYVRLCVDGPVLDAAELESAGSHP
jgi:NAD(P)H-flavin reductase